MNLMKIQSMLSVTIIPSIELLEVLARQVLSIAGGLQNVVLPTTVMKIMNNLIVIKDEKGLK